MNTAKPQDYFPDRRQALREIAIAATAGAYLTHELIWPGKFTLAADPKAAPGDWGAVKGRIVLDSKAKLPEVRPVNFANLKLPDADLKFFTAAPNKVVYEDWVINPKTRAVSHVFVWLREDSTEKNPKAIPIHQDLKNVKLPDLIMDQESLGYRPHAVGVREGQTLIVKNGSPIFHSLVWTSEKNKEGNTAMPVGSSVKFESMKAEPLAIPFSCAPHPWEKAWVRVFDHPYFAVTGQDGTFEIKLAPGGKLRLAVWQETLGWRGGKEGRYGMPITVPAGAVLDLGDLTVQPST